MRLSEIMSTGVETIAPTASADEAWNLMRREGVRHLVVVDGRDVLGVVSERDLGGPRGAAVRAGRRASDVMTTPVVAAEPHTTLRQAANRMRGHGVGCLPILERGRLRGIVTTSDLLAQIGRGEKPATNGKSARWLLARRGARKRSLP